MNALRVKTWLKWLRPEEAPIETEESPLPVAREDSFTEQERYYFSLLANMSATDLEEFGNQSKVAYSMLDTLIQKDPTCAHNLVTAFLGIDKETERALEYVSGEVAITRREEGRIEEPIVEDDTAHKPLAPRGGIVAPKYFVGRISEDEQLAARLAKHLDGVKVNSGLKKKLAIHAKGYQHFAFKDGKVKLLKEPAQIKGKAVPSMGRRS